MEEGFWGEDKGSDSEKSEHAERVLYKILSDAKWCNVHLLPVSEC